MSDRKLTAFLGKEGTFLGEVCSSMLHQHASEMFNEAGALSLPGPNDLCKRKGAMGVEKSPAPKATKATKVVSPRKKKATKSKEKRTAP
eukprot:Skav219961  [mRNA]  locus=scaffold2879:285126:285826:+ [translate_table: standard]